jgi:lipoyl(octanoyl) transferase
MTADVGGGRARLQAAWCGRVPYEEAHGWQRQLASARARDLVGDVCLALEHEPVYTTGRHAEPANVLGTTDIKVVAVERGGDVTYHGPGQLVLYPIVRLDHAKAVRPYVEALEGACVRTAASFGVEARGGRGRTGVWVRDLKLASIGIKVTDRVTTHGLSFNVAPRLTDYAGIVPCGISDGGVCSLASLGVEATLEAVLDTLLGHLGETLGRRIERVPLPALLGPLAALSTADAMPR